MPYFFIGTIALILYCPAMGILSALTPWQGFRISSITHRRRRYKTLHLATLDRIGKLNKKRANQFHRSFTKQLGNAVRDNSSPIVFTSHLLRPIHLRSMRIILSTTAAPLRWRCSNVKISRWVRTGIRIQILIQEWRWITVPSTGVMVVIRPQCKKSSTKF